MDNFRICDAKPEDVEAMRTIVQYWWVELYPNEKYGITREDVAGINFLKPEYVAIRKKEIGEGGDKTHTFVLKNEENEVVGFCEVSNHDTYGEIDAMYLIKGLEGKGLGKKLMQQGLEWLRKDQDVRLKVVAYNTHAIEFYKKFGFKETANKVIHVGTQLPSGKEIPRIEMLKARI